MLQSLISLHDRGVGHLSALVVFEWLLDKITIQNKRILDHKGVEEFVKQEMPELIVTVGAGNIDRLVKPIKQKLENA